MPVNAPPEYFKAQERFLKARTREEKIEALEEMIRTLPKHKGSENLLAQLRAKLSKLREQEGRAGRKGGRKALKKEGDVMVAVLGFANSGKTHLLNALCGTRFRESEQMYSTTEPVSGIVDYGGAKIQLVEIPAFFRRQDMSIVHASDCVLLVAKSESEFGELEKILENFRINKPAVRFAWDRERGRVVEEIWRVSNMIRIYTKERGKEPERKPIVMKRGSTVRDVAERIHEDFAKYFKFAKVWGKSAKFPGERVGLEHVLEDGDVIEIRTK